MRTIIGYGNTLRGEDAFGSDVLKLLKSENLENIQLLTVYQLTPELVLDLLKSDEVIFIDACYSSTNQYKVVCNIKEEKGLNLSHHISYKVIIEMLNNLYNRFPSFQVYSILTNEFNAIKDITQYTNSTNKVFTHLREYLKN